MATENLIKRLIRPGSNYGGRTRGFGPVTRKIKLEAFLNNLGNKMYTIRSQSQSHTVMRNRSGNHSQDDICFSLRLGSRSCQIF